MKRIIWVLMVAVAFYMAFLGRLLTGSPGGSYNIVTYEFADKTLGLQIIQQWNRSLFADGTLLDLAKSHTEWDFAFLFFYTMLFFLYTYKQFKIEKWIWLKWLLYINLFLSFAVGLLDVTENCIMLYNFSNFTTPDKYIETYAVTMPKFILAGWVTVVWLISVNKTIFRQKEPKPVKV